MQIYAQADDALSDLGAYADASPNGSPVGITAQAQFPGDLPVYYSLVNPGGIFSIETQTLSSFFSPGLR